MAFNGNCCQNGTCSGCRTVADLTQTPPAIIQVVIDGVTLCTTCVDISGPMGGLGSESFFGKVISGDINGVYCCTLQSPVVVGECIWKATLPNPVVIRHTEGDCNNFASDITIDTITVHAVRSGTTGYDQYPQNYPLSSTPIPMNFMVTCDTTFVGGGSIGYTVGLFTYTATGYANCIDRNSMPNLINTCGVYKWFWLGPNGSNGQGHLGYLATGGSARVKMNACVCEGVDTISATISGVTLCSCTTSAPGAALCVGTDDILRDMKTTGIAPNGTYCLTKISSADDICVFQATVPTATGTTYLSTDGTCSGTICSTINFDTITAAVNYTNGVATNIDVRITQAATTGSNVVTFWSNNNITAPSGKIDGTYSSLGTSCGTVVSGLLQGVFFASGGSVSIAVNGC